MSARFLHLPRVGLIFWLIRACALEAWATPVEVTFPYTRNERPGPLKGLDAGSDPHGTFIWSEIWVGAVMTGPDSFDWTRIEQWLQRTADRGRHSIIRPVLDTWNQGSMPTFLTKIPGATHTNRSGLRVPVYDHPATRDALVRFVEAFGRKYDGDPRIGFVEVGMLGEWGEGWAYSGKSKPTLEVLLGAEGTDRAKKGWKDYYAVSLEVTPEARKDVFGAYQRSFRKTRILMPQPLYAEMAPEFGFHNDAFAFWKRPDHFHLRLMDSGARDRWRKSPVIGRVHPEFAKTDQVNRMPPDAVTPERILGWIQREHTSCLRLHHPSGIPELLREAFISAAGRTGYDLHLTRARWNSTGSTFQLRVAFTNSGVAPFYYRWPIEIAWAQDGSVRQTWSTDWDLRTVIPGDGEVLFESVAPTGFRPAPGAHLLIRIPNPLPSGPAVPLSHPIHPADIDGWYTLGKMLRTQSE